MLKGETYEPFEITFNGVDVKLVAQPNPKANCVGCYFSNFPYSQYSTFPIAKCTSEGRTDNLDIIYLLIEDKLAARSSAIKKCEETFRKMVDDNDIYE